MLLHDGSLVETLASIEIKNFGKGVGARVEKLETLRPWSLSVFQKGRLLIVSPLSLSNLRALWGCHLRGSKRKSVPCGE